MGKEGKGRAEKQRQMIEGCAEESGRSRVAVAVVMVKEGRIAEVVVGVKGRGERSYEAIL